jgi:hypothetical protein
MAAVAKSLELGKNVPNPMAVFAALAQLAQRYCIRCRISMLLGLQKAI